jgi:hypothetical protein
LLVCALSRKMIQNSNHSHRFRGALSRPFPEVHNPAINYPAASSAMFRRPKVNDDLALDNASDTNTGAAKHRSGGTIA